jgi:hypothetical protein
VVWPDFQPMRVPEEPVRIDLFRQNPVFYLPAFEISRLCRTASACTSTRCELSNTNNQEKHKKLICSWQRLALSCHWMTKAANAITT